MNKNRRTLAPAIKPAKAHEKADASPHAPTPAMTPSSTPRPTRARLKLDDLADHPENSNIMDKAAFNKLLAHLRDSGYYPPLIVRPLGAPAPQAASTAHTSGGPQRYQLLDGHHRARALRLLHHQEADCEIWPIDDAQALLYLATLNRLRGRDDLKRRAALIASLQARMPMDAAAFTKLIPESLRDLNRLATLLERPRPQPRQTLENGPLPVHFFLTRDQRDRLEACLQRQGPPRDQALMKLLDMAGA